jgi:hypothetical protein
VLCALPSNTLQRRTLSRITPALAFETNGLGVSFQQDSRRVSSPQKPELAVADEDARRERQIIKDALAGSRGRVSGANGPRRGSEYHVRPWSTG